MMQHEKQREEEEMEAEQHEDSRLHPYLNFDLQKLQKHQKAM
jgi:hypothetical protein